jgi:hypothetical protein
MHSQWTNLGEAMPYSLGPLQRVSRARKRDIRLAQQDGTSSADTATHVNDFANLLRPVEG